MTPKDIRLLHHILVPWWQEYSHYMRLWLLALAAFSCFALSVLVWFEEEETA